MKPSSCIMIGAGGLLALVILITIGALLFQNNPPVTQEPPWDSPQTRALAKRACFDCHSNETEWPWYDKMPIGSWIAVFDTVRGRRELNFSQWSAQSSRGGRIGREVRKVIENGSMPPALYTMMHAKATLNDQEKQQLIQGLENSLK